MSSSTRATVRPRLPCAPRERNLEELARYDPQFAEAVQQIKSARAAVDDVSATVRDYASRIQASPDRLTELEDRLEVLNRLKRKYGSSLADVLAHGQEVAAKLAEIENRDQLLAGATKRTRREPRRHIVWRLQN